MVGEEAAGFTVAGSTDVLKAKEKTREVSWGIASYRNQSPLFLITIQIQVTYSSSSSRYNPEELAI